MPKPPRLNHIVCSLFLLAIFLLIFARFLAGTSVLMTTDAMISSANASTTSVIHNLMPHWTDGSLLGGPEGSATQMASLLKAVLPGVLWNNLVCGLACLVASFIFLAWFGKRLSPWAVLCGALTAFWLGSNFTLLYAGHVQKPFVIIFFVCTLFAAGVPSWRGGLLWGSFTGLMFAQQPDVALFFALFAGAHLIFRLWQREGFNPLRWFPVLIPAIIVVFLFATGPLLSGYKLNVKDTVQVQTETPREKWEYITQWSWPPEETIAFIAPGYTGWRSGEPEGPYWGRMGRSAGWEQTHQGYMNFMMKSAYIGFIPVAFALFVLFACRRSPHRAEILFWGAAAAGALLLAFGKNFPLYALFYQLPIANNIRNPNKFLQIFQVALAILTAYGADRLLFGKPNLETRKSKEAVQADGVTRWFFWGVTGAAGILLLWASGLSLSQADSVAACLTQGWPAEAARIIVANQIKALWHAVFMAALTAAVFAVFSFQMFAPLRTKGAWMAAALALVIATDALLLSKHYVQPMPRSYIQANALTDFLKKNLGTQRVALLTQQGIYNIWLTYLLPYNQIPAFNFAQMPRMPVDYKNFLTAGSKDPIRMWRFSAVKYLLGPTAFEKQLPAGQLQKVFAYNLATAPDNEIQLIPNPNGAHAVFELLNSVPHYALVSGSKPETDEQALARIAGNGPLLNGQTTGSVKTVQYRPGRVELKTQSDAPAMLRVAERWNPDWKADVDGTLVEVKRSDYLCQGIELPPGAHTVTLTYSPAKLFFYLQVAGCLILLTTSVSLLFAGKNSPARTGVKNGAAAV